MENDNEKKIVELEQKITELTHNWKRALADYANLEKRVSSESALLRELSTGAILLKLLPIVDNLEQASQTLKDQGVDQILKQVQDVLSSYVVSSFSPLGERFDPTYHEAVMVDAQGAKDSILEVYEKGYLYNKNLLRPAKVRVGGREEKHD